MELTLTFVVLVLVLVLLVFDVSSPDVVLVGGLMVVTMGGVIDIDIAVKGYGNTTLLALGSLYVVAAGLRETGALDRASQFILGDEKNLHRLLAKMCPSVTLYSAFLNNTPIVAMGIPAIRGWCDRNDYSPSKLLIPLSYAAIFGGMCTLVGTSTNLVVHGLLQSHGMEGYGFFELAWIGVPCATVGLLYVIYVAPALLKERADIRVEEEEERAEMIEVEVVPDSPFIGCPVEEAEQAFLPGLALIRIDRGNNQIAPPEGTEELKAGDRLVFAPRDVARHEGESAEERIDLAPHLGPARFD